jgi:hypothetical protein
VASVKGEISDTDRCNGEWVAKWPSRSEKIHGYWFSQMMAPWFTAGEIVDKYKTSSALSTSTTSYWARLHARLTY